MAQTGLSQQDYDNLVRDAMRWRKQKIGADRQPPAAAKEPRSNLALPSLSQDLAQKWKKMSDELSAFRQTECEEEIAAAFERGVEAEREKFAVLVAKWREKALRCASEMQIAALETCANELEAAIRSGASSDKDTGNE